MADDYNAQAEPDLANLLHRHSELSATIAALIDERDDVEREIHFVLGETRRAEIPGVGYVEHGWSSPGWKWDDAGREAVLSAAIRSAPVHVDPLSGEVETAEQRLLRIVRSCFRLEPKARDLAALGIDAAEYAGRGQRRRTIRVQVTPTPKEATR